MTFNELSPIEELKGKIKFYRKQSGLSQLEMSEKMDMTRTAYAYIENLEDGAKKITPEFILKFAKVLNISPNLFLRNNDRFTSTILKSNIPSAKPIDPLILSNKEIRMIKMLRTMPRNYFENVFEDIRADYENENENNTEKK